MIEDFYCDSFSVKRPTVTESGSGGAKSTWQTVSSANDGRLRAMTTDEKIVFGKMGLAGGWVLYCGPDTDVLPKDRVGIDGLDYEVRGVLITKSKDRAYYKKVILTHVG